jgi:hypothetical protein
LRNAWMLLFPLVLVAVVCKPSYAEYRVTWYSNVTVRVQDPNHNCLGSMTYSCGGETDSDTEPAKPLTSWFSLVPDSLWGTALFENVPLLTNVGDTVWIETGADDVHYSNMVHAFSDGRNNTMWGLFKLKSAGSIVESGMIGHSESGYLNDCYPDFAGKTIGRIGLCVNDAWVKEECDVVPEPGAFASLLCGIAGMCGFARKKRKAY